MNDTSPEIQKILHRQIMARSGEERMIMGAQTFEAARELVKASLLRGLSETEWKRQFNKRIYGQDLPG